MKPTEALEILENVAKSVNTTRENHLLILKTIETLAELIKEIRFAKEFNF